MTKRAFWRFVKNNDSVLLEAMASLENELPGYQKRPEQIEFMTTVMSALGQPGVTVIEAGTGIGKSLGYLIPLLAMPVISRLPQERECCKPSYWIKASQSREPRPGTVRLFS